jgi:hypothetical protein
MTPILLQRISRVLPWLIGPLYCGVLALCLGQDANWDLRNYHFYNAYAFLHQRLDYDVAPAQVATYYNPLFYIPFHEAVLRLPPMLVGFLLGALQGLNFPLLFAIVRNVMAGEPATPWWRGFLIALIGVLGAANISELGTMFGDNLTSLLILGALWLLLANFRKLTAPGMPGALLPVITAGIMIGLAAGLKQPAAAFAVGWCVAMLFLPLPLAQRIKLAFVFGVGVLAGIAGSGGYWLYEMWSRYGNPLFPYFNHIFQSPMASIADYRDARFLPGSLVNALLFPFIIVLDPHRTAEIPFRDLRLPLFMVLLAAAGLYALLTKARGRLAPSAAPAAPAVALARHKKLFLLIGSLVAYAVWLKIFAIYRYLMPLEMLAPLGIWLLLDTLPWRKPAKNYAALGCLVLLLVTLRPGNWGRISWADDYFGVKPPALADPARTMVLMTGVDPMAYVIPFFPEPVRFLRIQSYFTGPSATPNGSDRLMQRLIAEHRGPLFVLYRIYEEKQCRNALQAYGLTIDSNDCRAFTPHIIEEYQQFPLMFCAVARTDTFNNNQ